MSSSEEPPVPNGPPPSYEDAAGGSSATAPPDTKTTATTSGAGAGRGGGGPAGGETTKLPMGKPRAPFPLDLPIFRSLRGKRVILASQSPRRRALLAQIGLTQVEVVPSRFEENLPKSLTPFDYVLRTAQGKCDEVYRRELDRDDGGEEPGLVLAADTIVVSGSGAILEKPRSEAQHRAMLRQLRDGGPHTVVTAVVAMAPLRSARDPGYVLETYSEETRVVFARDTSDDTLEAYLRTREGVDKAGGYGIQGIGAMLVDRIEGSFENVVGLPLRGTVKLIEKVVTKAEDEETLEGELSEEED